MPGMRRAVAPDRNFPSHACVAPELQVAHLRHAGAFRRVFAARLRRARLCPRVARKPRKPGLSDLTVSRFLASCRVFGALRAPMAFLRSDNEKREDALLAFLPFSLSTLGRVADGT